MVNWLAKLYGVKPVLDPDVPLAEVQAKVLAALEAYRGPGRIELMAEVAPAVREATRDIQFDDALDDLYDWADHYRVWVEE